MQNFDKQAKELIRDFMPLKVNDAVNLISAALKKNYELGKKHLHDPSHLMNGEHKIIKEADTFNPMH